MTWLPDSTVATVFADSYGYKLDAYKHRWSYRGVIIHTTGMGPVKRGEIKKADPFETAVWMYKTGIVGKAGPHYVVGQDGRCAQICPEDRAAWHVGSSGTSVYKFRPWLQKCAWWKQRWMEYATPLEMPVWLGGSCNANTIGIEVVPNAAGPGAAWSDEAWTTLTKLLIDICLRRRIPVNRSTVMSHSDAHPFARSAKGKPWDPPANVWNWDLQQERVNAIQPLGVPVVW